MMPVLDVITGTGQMRRLCPKSAVNSPQFIPLSPPSLLDSTLKGHKFVAILHLLRCESAYLSTYLALCRKPFWLFFLQKKMIYFIPKGGTNVRLSK